MNIYIYNLVGILFISLFWKKTNRSFLRVDSVSNKNIQIGLIIIIGLQLFFISAFRSGTVGIDLIHYIPGYRVISNTRWENLFSLSSILDFEYGYVIYNKIISIFSSNAQLLLIITSAIVIISFSYFIWKYSKQPWLSFYLFITLGFFNGSFNILRQYIAMSILIYSIKYIINRKLLKFISLLIFASLFHKTSVIFIILYPIYKIKINKKYIWTVLTICVASIFSSKYIIDIFVLNTKYAKYLNRAENGSGQGMLIVLILVFICALLFKKSSEKYDTNNDLWIHMLIITIFVNILALRLGILERIMRYFMISIIILIPNIIISLNDILLRVIARILIIVLTAYYYFFIIMSSYSSSSGTIPYLFMWK